MGHGLPAWPGTPARPDGGRGLVWLVIVHPEPPPPLADGVELCGSVAGGIDGPKPAGRPIAAGPDIDVQESNPRVFPNVFSFPNRH